MEHTFPFWSWQSSNWSRYVPSFIRQLATAFTTARPFIQSRVSDILYQIRFNIIQYFHKRLRLSNDIFSLNVSKVLDEFLISPSQAYSMLLDLALDDAYKMVSLLYFDIFNVDFDIVCIVLLRSLCSFHRLLLLILRSNFSSFNCVLDTLNP
jgi:hypothetical protein